MQVVKLEFTDPAQSFPNGKKQWSHCHCEFSIGMNYFVMEFIVGESSTSPLRFQAAQKKVGQRLSDTIFEKFTKLQQLTTPITYADRS